MNFWTQVILTFVTMLITDVCWAIYVRRVKDGSAFKAAMWAVMLFLTGAVATISYVNNILLLIPAAIGAFMGTFIAVMWDEKKAFRS